eukprot:scaffold14365_cov72-Skeletonema_dohrnii-CCMP3373.AAC.1
MSSEDSSILHGSGKSIDVASAETAKKLLGTARVDCRCEPTNSQVQSTFAIAALVIQSIRTQCSINQKVSVSRSSQIKATIKYVI